MHDRQFEGHLSGLLRGLGPALALASAIDGTPSTSASSTASWTTRRPGTLHIRVLRFTSGTLPPSAPTGSSSSSMKMIVGASSSNCRTCTTGPAEISSMSDRPASRWMGQGRPVHPMHARRQPDHREHRGGRCSRQTRGRHHHRRRAGSSTTVVSGPSLRPSALAGSLAAGHRSRQQWSPTTVVPDPPTSRSHPQYPGRRHPTRRRASPAIAGTARAGCRHPPRRRLLVQCRAIHHGRQRRHDWHAGDARTTRPRRFPRSCGRARPSRCRAQRTAAARQGPPRGWHPGPGGSGQDAPRGRSPPASARTAAPTSG